MFYEKISKKQAEIFKFIVEDKDYLICDGAIRTGKTTLMSIAFVLWAMTHFDDAKFAFCGKTVQSAERNIISELLKSNTLQNTYKIEYLRTLKLLKISQGHKTNYFYVFGGKDESSYMLVQGITLAGALFDEVALMPKSFVFQVLARMVSIDKAKGWFNCNPDSSNHWFYKDWILQAEKHNAKHIHFMLKDNPALSEKAIRKTEITYTGVFYQRYIKGEWVNAEGAIYEQFIEESSNYFTENPTNYDFINIGVDFGGNKSAHTFVATGISHDYKNIIALASERHEAKNINPEKLYTLLLNFINYVKQTYGDISFIYADSAEQTLIAGLRSKINLPIKNSIKNPIIDRIRAMNILLATNHFRYTKDAQTLKEALINAVYDNKSLTDKRLDNGTSDIDTLDAFEYSFEKYIRILAGG